MCGIAGVIQRSPDTGLPPFVARMTQAMHHRGPDDGGLVWFTPDGAARAARLGGPREPPDMRPGAAAVALGARRLAIVDLSPRGRQPMSSDDGRAWIVFNGEIYNHVELRQELRAAGRTFGSATDTEVALHAWLAWGPACFERFNGMWAMAVYEAPLRRLTLSRDRFGIKPLHYLRLNDGLAFASEIRPLLLHPASDRRVNAARLVEFLCEGWIDHTDETLFACVSSVPAGGRVTVSCRAADEPRICIDHDQWPDAPGEEDRRGRARAAPTISSRPADAGAARDRSVELRARLDVEMALHLRGDVPVGSCLSGGIDSSGVVATIDSLRRRTAGFAPAWSQHTFTAVLPGDPLDESRHAEAVLAACSELRGHRVEPTADGLLADLSRLIDAQEQPFGGPSIFMQWEVMKRASAAGLNVLLDGQGGDELFCGYPGCWPPYVADLLRRGAWLEACRIARAPEVREQFRGAALLPRVAARLLPRDAREALRRRRWSAAGSLASAALIERAGERAGVRHDHGGAPSDGDDSFDGFRRGLLRRWSLPCLLRYEDRSSMAFSIEARVPLLGRTVADWAMELPSAAHLADGRTKAALRAALRGRVPDSILDRRDKIGFAAPTLRWMSGPLQAWWRDVLSSEAARSRGWLDPKSLRRLELRMQAGVPAAADRMWRAALALDWAERFAVN